MWRPAGLTPSAMMTVIHTIRPRDLGPDGRSCSKASHRRSGGRVAPSPCRRSAADLRHMDLRGATHARGFHQIVAGAWRCPEHVPPRSPEIWVEVDDARSGGGLVSTKSKAVFALAFARACQPLGTLLRNARSSTVFRLARIPRQDAGRDGDPALASAPIPISRFPLPAPDPCRSGLRAPADDHGEQGASARPEPFPEKGVHERSRFAGRLSNRLSRPYSIIERFSRLAQRRALPFRKPMAESDASARGTHGAARSPRPLRPHP